MFPLFDDEPHDVELPLRCQHGTTQHSCTMPIRIGDLIEWLHDAAPEHRKQTGCQCIGDAIQIVVNDDDRRN